MPSARLPLLSQEGKFGARQLRCHALEELIDHHSCGSGNHSLANARNRTTCADVARIAHHGAAVVGSQSNVADWLALADITVLPSLYEGLPLVAIESLAAQRCMVATAVDGGEEE